MEMSCFFLVDSDLVIAEERKVGVGFDWQKFVAFLYHPLKEGSLPKASNSFSKLTQE